MLHSSGILFLSFQPKLSLCMGLSSAAVLYLSPASDKLRLLWLAPVAASIFDFVYTSIFMLPEIKILLENDVITKKGTEIPICLPSQTSTKGRILTTSWLRRDGGGMIYTLFFQGSPRVWKLFFFPANQKYLKLQNSEGDWAWSLETSLLGPTSVFNNCKN